MLLIREATLADGGAIAGLMTSLGHSTTEREMVGRLRATLAHADYVSMVAHEGDRTVGFLGLVFGLHYEKSGTYARVVALYVSEDTQGKGIDTALLRQAEELSRRRGAGAMLLNSGVQQAAAHTFYEGHGFATKEKAFYKALA